MLKVNSKHVTNSGHDFKYSKCDFKASKAGALEAHILIAHEENKPFRCEVCPSRFERKTQLIERMMIVHAPTKQSILRISPKGTNQVNVINEVCPRFQAIFKFQCSKCDFSASTTGTLEANIFAAHE